MATINRILESYAIQALTRPRKPVVHIQKPKVHTPQKIEIGKISVGTRGRIINIRT